MSEDSIPKDIIIPGAGAGAGVDTLRAELARTDSVPSTERFFRACAAGEVTFTHIGREVVGQAWVATGGGYDGTKLIIPDARCPKDIHRLTPLQLARIAYES